MVRQVRVEVLSDARKYTPSKQVDAENKRIVDHTRRASGALKAAFATFSAGAVVVALKSTVDAASATNETVSKTKVVFGPAAKAVEDFSKRAATSMGLSRQEAMESAATFGNLFVSMKIGAPKAAEMSTKMVQLAGDLASFNNANPQETLEALRSGLVGETEPLRKFGINLNDADLRQKALSMGLVKTTKEVLPPAVKAQAAYALILEQSKTAQGDFARTSGGLANQQRILAAKIKDLQASIGSVLLPVVLKGVSAFNSFLGVVDRNKIAFGILFGVLGAGGAVIGGLVLIEKTHKAVTEGVTAATEAWKTVQKGLNTILGVTKVQAVAATAATEAQATATVAAGTAAQVALPLISKLALGIGAVVIAVHALTQKSRDYNEVGKSTNDAVSRYGLVAGLTASQVTKLKGGQQGNATATKQVGLETAYAAQQAELQRQAMVASLPAYQTMADKERLNAVAIKDMSTKLAEARGELEQNRASMAQTIESYQGLISKSKLTAAEVIKDIHNQVDNFRTYSSDVHRLIKAGVSQDAILELSQKGPEYIHALARGSKTQLQDYKNTWVARNREIKGNFAASIDAQYRKLAAQIRSMQREIDKLKGKTITITARTNVEITKSVRQYLAASNIPGFHAKGTLIPGYGGGDIYPAMLEPGEGVVPKDKAKRPEFRAWAKAMGIPGFQFGGLAGRYYNPTVGETRRIGISEGMVAAAVLRQLGGSAGIKAFIRSVDPLPYIWGGAGPYGYDCSGLVSAVLGKVTGRGGGHGQRYFTTATIRSGILGIKPGLGGVLQIGVTPSRGHMVGAYGGLGFEAESTRTGIKIGAAATTPASMARHFHLARGGLVKKLDPRTVEWLAHQPGIIIGGDQGRLRIDRYDQGGMLPSGRMAINTTGRPEALGFDYDKMAEANVRAMKAAGLGAVYLDGRRVDSQQHSARVLNSRRN